MVFKRSSERNGEDKLGFRMVKEYDLLDGSELAIWNRFKKYNRIKYLFLYFIGFLSGIILISIIFLVM